MDIPNDNAKASGLDSDVYPRVFELQKQGQLNQVRDQTSAEQSKSVTWLPQTRVVDLEAGNVATNASDHKLQAPKVFPPTVRDVSEKQDTRMPDPRLARHSASDLGAPIERKFNPADMEQPKRDLRAYSMEIGNAGPHAYFERWSAGISISVTDFSGSNPEYRSRTDVSAGVGGSFSNPTTSVELYAQPVGTVQRYGLRVIKLF